MEHLDEIHEGVAYRIDAYRIHKPLPTGQTIAGTRIPSALSHGAKLVGVMDKTGKLKNESPALKEVWKMEYWGETWEEAVGKVRKKTRAAIEATR